MPTRTTYSALTPEATNFAVPQSPIQEPFPSYAPDRIKTRWIEFLSHALELTRNNTGLLLVAASQFFFSLMNLAVKKLHSIDPPVQTLELIIVRMGITWICCVLYMYATKVPDPFLGPKGVRLLLATRGFSGFFGLFGVYYSLQYLSLSDATVLTFLSPMTTAIAGALLLNETFTRKEVFAGLFSLLGVVMIARPTFMFGSAALPSDPTIPGGSYIEKGTPSERLGAVGIALVGVLGATGALTSLRAIGKRAHPLHSLVAFSSLCVTVATIGMVITKSPVVVPTRLDFLSLLALIGIFGFFAQTLLTMGLQRETAGRGAMAIYLQIIFATILERIFFYSIPSTLSVVGTCIIMASAIYVALTKTNAIGNTIDNLASVTLGGAEEVAMEEGLIDGMEPVEMDTTIVKPIGKLVKEEGDVEVMEGR